MDVGFGRRSGLQSKPAFSYAIARSDGDNRFAPRRQSQTPAQIYFDGTTVSVPCLIRDMSTTGARLELRDGWDNPFKSEASAMDRIKLVVRMDRVMYECRIMRRGETELGVKFIAAPKPMTKVVR
jgi:PilZ domain